MKSVKRLYCFLLLLLAFESCSNNNLYLITRKDERFILQKAEYAKSIVQYFQNEELNNVTLCVTYYNEKCNVIFLDYQNRNSGHMNITSLLIFKDGQLYEPYYDQNKNKYLLNKEIDLNCLSKSELVFINNRLNSGKIALRGYYSTKINDNLKDVFFKDFDSSCVVKINKRKLFDKLELKIECQSECK